jgi:heat shock protein HslJ
MSKKLDARFILLVIIFILGGSLAACGVAPPPESALADPDLTESEWILASLNGKPVSTGTTAPLVFADANNVLGATGCNLFAGTYSIGKGNIFNFQPNVTTTWVCEELMMVQEQAMLQIFSSNSSYVIEGDELSITNQGDDRRGTFKRMEPSGVVGTEWNLDAYNDGQGALVNLIEGTRITASFGEDGSLTGSAGCNKYTTMYEADAIKISVGQIALAPIACSGPSGIMDQESKYLTALNTAAAYRNLGIALDLFDAEGQILASYISADLFIELK